MPEGQFELEIPRGDNSLSSTPTGVSLSTDSSTSINSENIPIPQNSEHIPVAPSGANIFLEDSKSTLSADQSDTDEDTEEEKNVSKYIRIFIIASVVTLINIIIIGLLYSYNIYISQASKVAPDMDKVSYVQKYQTYLDDITSLLGTNHSAEYSALPLTTQKEYTSNFHNIVTTDDISYIQKRDILKEKLAIANTNVANKAREVETIDKNIARYGFLPLEIRNILQNEEAISAIQRSLSSLEIIKFSTALKVFSYMDSVVSIISDSLRIDKDSVFSGLESFANRGEKDVSNYVYMCYLNPFETSTECNTIGDFDLYYQDILQDTIFDKNLFKNVMKYLDIMLEQSDIPSFSILFNGFSAGSKTINFNIEVNTTKQDELRLIAKGIKNPHIFIFTSLINLLKQSVFIIGENIDTKTINIATRTIEVGNTAYTVNTSSKRFELPIQKSTEREIFDYIDIDYLLTNIAGEVEEVEEPTKETEVQPIEENPEVIPTSDSEISSEEAPVQEEIDNISDDQPMNDQPIEDTTTEQPVEEAQEFNE
jgi:hypothetical protein